MGHLFGFFYLALFAITLFGIKEIKWLIIIFCAMVNGLVLYLILKTKKECNRKKNNLVKCFTILSLPFILYKIPLENNIVHLGNLLENHISIERAAYFGNFILFLEYIIIYTLVILFIITIVLPKINKKDK